MKKIKIHIYTGLLFITLGVVAVLVRRKNSEIEWVEYISDATETIGWAALFTIFFSFIFLNSRNWKFITPIISLLFCWSVEFLQMTNIPGNLEKEFPPSHYLLGSNFDSADLPWYGLGVLLSWFILLKFIDKKMMNKNGYSRNKIPSK